MPRFEQVLLFLLFLAGAGGAASQDFSGFTKVKPFDWSASINAGLTSVNSNSNKALYSPFAYSFGINSSLSVYGFDLPFSFIFRDRQASYGASFSRFSLSPSYKWAKLYLGHSQLEYNKYLLSGMQVYGVGVEINPGVFRFAVISGKVYNPKILSDTLTQHSGIINPYCRKLTAFKLGIGNNRNYIDFSLLMGSDQDKNLDTGDSLFYAPQANTCLGVSTSFDIIGKSLNIAINGAASAVTHNKNGAELEEGDLKQNGILSALSDMVEPNKSTTLSFAGDAILGYTFRSFSLKARYQRIDPFYQSFGVNFLRGDRENISLQSAISLFNGVVSLSGSYGIDRNNLVNLRSSTVRQKIYDINVQINPVRWFGLDAQLSNYNFGQKPSLQNVLDTVRFIQINATNAISPYLRFHNKVWQHSIHLNVTKQSLNDLSSNDFATLYSSNISYSVGYQIRNRPNKWNAGMNLFKYEYKNDVSVSNRTGLSINVSTAFMHDRLNVRIRSSISSNQQNKVNAGLQFNIGPTITIKVGKGSLMLQHNYITRKSAISMAPFNESRFYTNFSMPIK